MIVRFLSSTRVRYLLLTAVAFVYAAAIAYFLRRDTLYDFNIYYLAAYGFVHGVDIYALSYDVHGVYTMPYWQKLAEASHVKLLGTTYIYPPLTAQLVVPLLGFSELAAGAIWLTLTAVAFLLSAWLLGKLWTQPEGPSLVYLLLLAFVPPLFTLLEGQINGFLLLAVTISLVGLTRRNWGVTGSALAFAALLKILPIVLCLYLGWRKLWLAATAAVLALIGLLLSAQLMFGPNLLVSYFRNFFTTTRFGTLYSKIDNQGLSGVWLRLLAGVVDPTMIYRVYLVAAGVLIIATIMICWPLRDLPAYWRFEFALIICALLMIPPYIWYHMLSLLFIPLVIVVEELWRNRRWKLLALVLAMDLVMGLHGIIYHRAFPVSRWLTFFPFLFVLFLWGMLGWMILQKRRGEKGDAANKGELLEAGYRWTFIPPAGNVDKSGSSVAQ